MFLGRHLLVLLPEPSNGSLDAYGTVTRVWGNDMVNMLVVPDASLPVVHGSVPVLRDLEAARARHAEGYRGPVAYPPPRAA